MRIKVTRDNRITLPAEVRAQLGIRAGDYVLVEVDENSIVLTAPPRSFSERLRGLHREVWQVTNTDEYLRQERDAWEQPR